MAKSPNVPPSFADAVEKLSQAGILKKEIYLIDLVLLREMAWANGAIQEDEREILFDSRSSYRLD